MNIQKAKEQIRKTMQVYFAKDELGKYQLPVQQQRPVFLIGPPGIGKTAIMEQIAQELNVGLVTYSMTHHTRQSALGLPFIVEKEFRGQQYHIAEYTMSEIIAAVYREIEEKGHEEGILFLDEINCVSETLAPAMLQFLQYKEFGMHSVPQGWLIVTAGNPPEYNASAREFDLATWDRLKRIDVEPDFQCWKEYARAYNVHPAVRTYLELHPQHFYDIYRTVDGQNFVTARGWEDLSVMLQLYEKQGLTVDEELFGQYLQHEKIQEEFSIYYDLYQKYQSDYQIQQILSGEAMEAMASRAKEATFDERITVSGMLCDAIENDTRAIAMTEDTMLVLRDWLKEQKSNPEQLEAKLEAQIAEIQNTLAEKQSKKKVTKAEYDTSRAVIGTLSEILGQMRRAGIAPSGDAQFQYIKGDYQNRVKSMKEDAAALTEKLGNLFTFIEKAFGTGTEMLLVLAELTAQEDTSRFIGRYGCEAYYRFSKELMVQERQDQILRQLMRE